MGEFEASLVPGQPPWLHRSRLRQTISSGIYMSFPLETSILQTTFSLPPETHPGQEADSVTCELTLVYIEECF